MTRKPTKPGLDKKMFRKTAVNSKKINVNPTIYRGGIRL